MRALTDLKTNDRDFKSETELERLIDVEFDTKSAAYCGNNAYMVYIKDPGISNRFTLTTINHVCEKYEREGKWSSVRKCYDNLPGILILRFWREDATIVNTNASTD